MDANQLQWLFKDIAEGDSEKSLKAAMQIVNTADDKVLQSELTNFALTMSTAKDSVEQDKVIDALNLYFKKQMSLLFIQAFTFGQKYQHAIDLIVIPEALEKSKEEILAKEATELKEEE